MNANDIKNREDTPCHESAHRFPAEYYDCASDDTSADEYCCTYCGWSRRELNDLASVWELRFKLASEVARAIENDLTRENMRVRSERDSCLKKLEDLREKVRLIRLALHADDPERATVMIDALASKMGWL